MSPWNWRENKTPAIFARDPYFRPTVTGLTRSETTSVVATRTIDRTVKRTGVNPGTLRGITRAERLAQIKGAQV